MRRLALFLVILSFVLVGCGAGSSQPLGERMVGKWTGAMTNKDGDKIPVEWQFMEGGTMVVKFPLLGVSYGGKWSAEGSRLSFTTEVDPEEKNYREVELIDDDTVKLTKTEAKIEETFTRAK